MLHCNQIPDLVRNSICKSKDVDAAVGVSSFSGRRPMSSDMSPEGRIASYGGSLAPLSIRLPPAQNSGRNDPIAMLGHGIANRSNQKKAKKAQEDMAEGKTKKWDSLEGGLKWVRIIVRGTYLRTVANAFLAHGKTGDA